MKKDAALLDGDVFDWDAFQFSDLTLGELEELETELGLSMEMIVSVSQPKAVMLRRLVLILRRRADPAATYEGTAAVRLKPRDREAPAKRDEVDPPSATAS